MMRRYTIPFALCFSLSAILSVKLSPNHAQAAEPQLITIAPLQISYKSTQQPTSQVLAGVAKLSGVTLSVSGEVAERPINVNFQGVPFWEALEEIAKQSGSRIVPTKSGKALTLVPLGKDIPVPPSAIDGAFRIVLKQIIAKQDFESGKTSYELRLDAMWEPRFPVFYMETEPTIVSILGAKAGTPAGGRAPTTGYTHPLVVRLSEIPRSTTHIEKIELKLHAIAADKMLLFTFDTIESDKPISKKQDDVTVKLKPIQRTGTRTDVKLELEYPASQPALESFEQFTWNNQLRLLQPEKLTAHRPKDYQLLENANKVNATYYYEAPNANKDIFANLKGWKLVYETPSPLKNVELNFTLKNLRLP